MIGTVRGFVWLSLAAAVLLAAVVGITPRLVGANVIAGAHAEAVVAAAVICITAGWVALTPLVLSMSLFRDYVLQAATASVALRLLVTMAAGAGYLTWASPPKSPFMTAIVGWYLALLVLETAMVVLLTRKQWGS